MKVVSSSCYRQPCLWLRHRCRRSGRAGPTFPIGVGPGSREERDAVRRVPSAAGDSPGPDPSAIDSLFIRDCLWTTYFIYFVCYSGAEGFLLSFETCSREQGGEGGAKN